MKKDKLLQWTIFIDMLGYRDINGQIDSDEKAKDFIEFMNSNVDMVSSQDSENLKKIYKESSFDLYSHYEIKTLFISDSLIITYKPKKIKLIRETEYYMHSANTLFIIISRLQEFIYKCLKEKNIFLRGGISNGYCNVDNTFAFGNGLIEAYEVESNQAIYPRICLHESVTKQKEVLDKLSFICRKIYNSDSLIKFDGKMYFVDYLQYGIFQSNRSISNMFVFKQYFDIHKNSIIQKIKEIDGKIGNAKSEKELLKKIRIKEKFLWLKDYHNEKLINLSKEFLIP